MNAHVKLRSTPALPRILSEQEVFIHGQDRTCHTEVRRCQAKRQWARDTDVYPWFNQAMGRKPDLGSPKHKRQDCLTSGHWIAERSWRRWPQSHVGPVIGHTKCLQDSTDLRSPSQTVSIHVCQLPEMFVGVTGTGRRESRVRPETRICSLSARREP